MFGAFWFVHLIMGQEYRRRRRISRCGSDMDDRGWTMLHIGACKGDIKEVVLCYYYFF